MASQSELEPLSPNDYGIRRPLQSQFSQGSSSVGADSWSFWRRRPKKAAPLRQNDDNGSQMGWKPLSMDPAILMLLTILTLLIAGAVEVLAQLSQAKGGLALSRTQDEIPQYAMISYLYVPNIVAVLYSLIWSWVDLDVKRMQPWFELSKPEGATAENSMFLDYPYDFIATVPIKAARRRHWPVFFAGTVTVVIFWLITPLQSSIMGTGFVNKTEPAIIATRSSMVPLAEQAPLLTNEILNTAYAIEWLGQSFPSFTTPDYAILPFYIDNDPGASQQQLNWTAETTKLWTELECWPATYWRGLPSKVDWYFDNGQGCTGLVEFDPSPNLVMDYIGYYTSPYADWNLQDPHGCPATENSTHQFLAIWALTTVPSHPPDVSPTPEVNITALFCQPSYYKQQVMVTVVTDGYKPQNTSIQPISPRETLTEKEFNSTSFEFLIFAGMPLEQLLVTKRDFPFESVMQLGSRIDKTGLLTPVNSGMVGYALDGRNEPATPYSDPNTLHEAFERAHKYLFAIAVNHLLSNETDVGNSTAISSFEQSGIIVSRLFSAIVESLLLLVAIFTISLLWICRRSTSYLNSNPSSISRLVAIFRNGSETSELFRPVDHADEKSLRELFQDDKFRLTRSDNNDSRSLYIEKVDNSEQEHGDKRFDKPTGYYEPIRPTALRREMGLLFGVVQIGALVGIVYLKAQNDRQNGLIRPSSNFEVLQILENYIPTAFATFSEPFWVLLNRFLCLLQPFRTMSKGRSSPSKSIETTYTALPPQLVAWRALRARHLMLAMICIIALLSNVLAVGLGALFNEDLTTANYTATFTPNVAPLFDNQSTSEFTQDGATFLQFAYLAMANISSGAPLPPWTTSDYFFQSYTVDSGNESNSSSTYRVPTRGFSINANCTAVPSSELTVTFPNNTYISCANNSSDIVKLAKWEVQTSQNIPSQQSAFENSLIMDPGIASYNCSRTITFGWGRKSQTVGLNRTMEGSFAFCQPYLQTAMFDVRHDSEGNVLAYERTSEVSMHLDGEDQGLQTNRMISLMNNMLGIPGNWHNDTLTRDMMNYLLAISLDSRDFLDAKKPPPDPNDLIPTIEKLYRKLFVIILGANLKLFVPGDKTLSVTGQKLTDETRIFVDQNAFIITVTILGLNIIAVIIFYSRGIMFNLPRVPTTIGSILAFVSASHILLDDDKKSSSSGDTKEEKTYSFGRYIGVDQKVHLGIDMDPHVALVDPASLEEKRSFVYRIVPSGLRKRKDIGPVSDSTWL
ncbi:uncharacterized protein TrAtP1_011788 [Trichoderma atroviride]|uniref:uncharacterized protein n=1 Tax=Hypocrea atroviridis TaxID=63577 RepID=UPI0033216DBC|nr:hypothetical protein TrAtP1_011788 [Trichoderma atroviride]